MVMLLNMNIGSVSGRSLCLEFGVLGGVTYVP